MDIKLQNDLSIHIQDISAAISLIEVTSFHMQSVVISESTGYGLFCLNLRGNNNITSSQFKKNNAKCTTEDCIGGNAAFYFFRAEKPETVNLSITSSTFSHGVDKSNNGKKFSCSAPRNKLVVYKAQGLAIITGQDNYQIGAVILNSSVEQNNGSSDHPAVWVHDFGGVRNNSYQFVNCRFQREGTLRMSSVENPYCTGDACYIFHKKNTHYSTPHFEIRECTFSESSQRALEICVEPTKVRFKKFQLITISDCTFQNNTEHENGSLIYIEYNIVTKKYYPSIIVTIEKCQFIFNSIPILTCQLGNDTYADYIGKINKYSYQAIINLQENYFMRNINQKSATVLIKTPIEGRVPIWKYEKSVNSKQKSISRVLIFNCIFKNNTSSKQHGILQVENTYIIIDSLTFESSQGTALYALRSVIHIKGVNLFNGNNGTFGGALNLNMSRIFVTSNSHTMITNNTALYGGGMFALANWTAESFETYGQCTVSY